MFVYFLSSRPEPLPPPPAASAATVRVGDYPVTLLKLDREGFNLLLGPLTEIMKRKIEG